MANTINKEEPYKLVENLIKKMNETSLTDPDRNFHKLYVTISSDFKNIDKVDDLADIIYELPNQNYENLQNVFGIGSVEQDLFSDFVNEIKTNAIKGISNEDFDDEFSTKFVEHIRLCCFQRNFMTKSVSKAETIANETLVIANTAKDSVEEVNETIDRTVTDLNEMKTKIYSEFIGILGIFTAIAFLVMGSLELLNNLFSDISNPTSRVIGYVLVAGGIYLLVLYLLMVSLFVGMKKVTGDGSGYDVNDGMFKLIVFIALILVFLGVLFSGGIVH
ncbi:hypothetical protein [Lactococcus lactis]|uniref:hypothetical protein n=1 Tax=Lactococcus lactis TaxID=1358 RepID=UPI00071D5D60|nr:hypothetical protein [Lactococcus lactis]KSU15690.1 hypothetical protein LMG14418_2348 [Lactococcus lactis subsp. lactis]MCX7531459.1 hypothetical protein [Lactococcus lactis]MDM7474928.1 hypothetical protein [Lactococcus lactis]NEX58924.1 hypothetical protein [Lactococcus lactis]